MASDAGVYSYFNHPTTELLDPFEIQRRRLGVQNALAAQQLQQQALTGGQLDIDLKRRTIADADAERVGLMRLYGVNPDGTPIAAAAGAPAPAPAPGAPGPDAGGSAAWSPGVAQIPMSAAGSAAWGPGAPPPDAAVAVPPPAAAPAPGGAPPSPAAIARRSFTMSDLLQAGVPITKAPEVLGHLQAAEKQSAEIQGLKDKSAEVMQEYAAEMANGWIKSGNNPAVLGLQLQHFAAHGPEYAQMASKIAQTFQSDPAAASAWMKSLAVGTKDARAAASREQEVANQTDKTADELRVSRTKQYGGLLGSTRDKASYDSVLKRLDQIDPKLADDAGFDREWTPQSAALAKQKGMSAQEQVTTAQTAATAAEAARHNKVEEGIRGLEASLSRQRLDWEKTGGASLDNPVYMAGVVDGTIQINPRDKNFAATEAAAKAIDKTWSADRFNNRKTYMQSVTSGALGRDLTSINQGLAHLGEYKAASDRVGVLGAVTPGAGMVSGDVRAFMNARDTSGHELTTMFNSGSGTQSETHQTQGNLNSWTQDARNTGVNQYAKLIAGRIRAVAKKHTSATGEPFPVDQFIDSSAVDFLKSQGVDVYKLAADESKTWLKSHGGGGAPAAAADHGIPDLGSTFNGGKVLKVTPVP